MKLFFLILVICMISCESPERSAIEVIKFDPAIIDSLKQTADTSYSELIGRSDFFTAEHYLIREDSTQTKILKDSVGNVVGILQTKNGVRLFVAEYYPNGQIKGKVSQLHGKIDGPSKYYYPDGRIRSIGLWKNQNQVGAWKEYFENGSLKGIINYDDSGTVINRKEFSN